VERRIFCRTTFSMDYAVLFNINGGLGCSSIALRREITNAIVVEVGRNARGWERLLSTGCLIVSLHI